MSFSKKEFVFLGMKIYLLINREHGVKSVRKVHCAEEISLANESQHGRYRQDVGLIFPIPRVICSG